MVCARMLTILLWIAFVKYEGEILTQLQKNVCQVLLTKAWIHFFLHSLDSPLSSLSSSSFLELLAFIKFASMTLTPTGWGYTPPANQNSVDMNNFAML